MTEPVLALSGAVACHDRLPSAPLDLVLAAGEFALVEVVGRRRAAAFADVCMGLTPLAGGEARVLGREWRALTAEHADALRGRIGRLFAMPIRLDTSDVAARVLLARLYHTRIPESVLRAEAAALAVRLGLPGLPTGPARLLSDADLLRAGCVRAFLGAPRLLILELPLSAQEDAVLSACLSLGAEARSSGAAVLWLAAPGPALRHGSLAPVRLHLGDTGLAAPTFRRAA